GLKAQNGLEAEGDGVRGRTSLEPGGPCPHQFEEIPRPRRFSETHEDLARREPRDFGHERAIEVQKAAGGRDGVEERGPILESLLEDLDMERAPRVVERTSKQGPIRFDDERGRVRRGKAFDEPEKVWSQGFGSAADLPGVLFRARRPETPKQGREERQVPSSKPERYGRAGFAIIRLARRDPVVVALGAPCVDDGERRSREQRAHVAGRELHTLVRVGSPPRVLPPPPAVHLKPEYASRLQDARGFLHVTADRRAVGDVLEDDEGKDEVQGLSREVREGTVREHGLHVRRVRRIFLRLLDHDGRNVHAMHDRNALREGDEKPADAAPDLENLGGRIQDGSVEHDPLEGLLPRGTKPLLAAGMPGRDVELVTPRGAPVPVAAHAGKNVVRRLPHRNSKIAFALALLPSRF